jgi:hypothetical protein
MEQAVKELVFKPWNQKVQKREKTQRANVPLVSVMFDAEIRFNYGGTLCGSTSTIQEGQSTPNSQLKNRLRLTTPQGT